MRLLPVPGAPRGARPGALGDAAPGAAGALDFKTLVNDYITEQAAAPIGIDAGTAAQILGNVESGDYGALAVTLGGAAAAGGCAAVGLVAVAPLCATVGGMLGQAVAGALSSGSGAGFVEQLDAFAHALAGQAPTAADADVVYHHIRDDLASPYIAAREAWDAGEQSLWMASEDKAALKDAENQAGDAFYAAAQAYATAEIAKDFLRVEAEFLARVADLAASIYEGYAPFCSGACSPQALRGMIGEMAYAILSAQRFGGAQSPGYLTSIYRDQIEGHIAETTGHAPEGVTFRKGSQYHYGAPTGGGFVAAGGDAAGDDGPSGVAVAAGVALAGAAAWAGWRAYKGRPILPRF